MKRLVFAVFVCAAITLTLADTNKERDHRVHPPTSAMVHPVNPRATALARGRRCSTTSQGGAWVDRVKMPAGKRVLAHTHPQDELVTVIEGTWYLGEGTKFNLTNLKGYPAGSFIVIPAGEIGRAHV